MGEVRDFLLPDLGEGLEEGEIVAWNVDVGQTIDLNQTLCQVETAKAVVDIPSPFAGTVVERFGEVGEALQVGQTLVRIDVSGAAGVAGAVSVPAESAQPEAVPGGAPSPAQAATAASPVEAEAQAPAQADGGTKRQSVLVGYGAAERTRRKRGGRNAKVPTGHAPTAPSSPPAPPMSVPGSAAPLPGDRPRAKPPVRKLAKDLGVDLSALAGSGPEGTITRDDVHAAAGDGHAGVAAPAATTAPSTAPAAVPVFGAFAPGQTIPVRGIRARIAEKMSHSRREIPEATCSVWADCTDLWAIRTRLTDAARAEGHDVKVTPFALVLRATVLALRRFPTLNATLDQEAGCIRLHDAVHLGVAADTPRGLIVPVVRDAHAMSTLQLAVELSRLAVAARDGSVKPNELSGSTFTVTNYGAFGNDDGDPVINHPEAAILGVGAMKERPWVVDGAVAVRRTVKITCAFDHRISDGGEAGRFVTYIGELVEDPARILLHA